MSTVRSGLIVDSSLLHRLEKYEILPDIIRNNLKNARYEGAKLRVVSTFTLPCAGVAGGWM